MVDGLKTVRSPFRPVNLVNTEYVGFEEFDPPTPPESWLILLNDLKEGLL